MADIAFGYFNRYQGFITFHMAAGVFHHRRGIIHGDDPAAGFIRDIRADRQGGGSAGTAEIINLTAGRDKTAGQHANHGNNIRVARN